MSFQAKNEIKQYDNPKKPKVALLGMFHFAGSSSDLAAIKLKNPLGAKRQKEMLELVKTLKEYRPTKIMVEYPEDRQIELNKKLSNYLNAKDTLGVSETYQIGFRLVEQLGLKEIFGIDYKLNLPTEDIVKYCQRTDRMNNFNSFIGKIQSMMQDESNKLSQLTIREYLAYMNTDEIDRIANDAYLNDMLKFGDSVSEAGIESSAIWWKRNMYILKNITEKIENEEERILVIIGSAHRAVLKDFIEDRSDVDYIEISDYLN